MADTFSILYCASVCTAIESIDWNFQLYGAKPFATFWNQASLTDKKMEMDLETLCEDFCAVIGVFNALRMS